MMHLLKSFPIFSWVTYFLIFECRALKYIWATKSIRFGNWKCILLVYDLSFHSLTIETVCMSMYMHVHVCTYMQVHMCWDLINKYIPQLFFPGFFFGNSIFHWPWSSAVCLGRLGREPQSQPFLSQPSQHSITGDCTPAFVVWVLEVGTQVPRLVQQAL